MEQQTFVAGSTCLRRVLLGHINISYLQRQPHPGTDGFARYKTGLQFTDQTRPALSLNGPGPAQALSFFFFLPYDWKTRGFHNRYEFEWELVLPPPHLRARLVLELITFYFTLKPREKDRLLYLYSSSSWYYLYSSPFLELISFHVSQSIISLYSLYSIVSFLNWSDSILSLLIFFFDWSAFT